MCHRICITRYPSSMCGLASEHHVIYIIVLSPVPTIWSRKLIPWCPCFQPASGSFVRMEKSQYITIPSNRLIYSLVAFVGPCAHRVCNYLHSTLHIHYSILLFDVHRTSYLLRYNLHRSLTDPWLLSWLIAEFLLPCCHIWFIMYDYCISDSNSVLEAFLCIHDEVKFTFRYLNDYEVLREPPLTKPDAKELHPDVHSADVPPTMFHNYLDEFLQAIRVFGFLEKPVSMTLKYK